MARRPFRLAFIIIAFVSASLAGLGICLVFEMKNLSRDLNGATASYLQCRNGECTRGYSIAELGDGDAQELKFRALSDNDLRTYEQIIKNLRIDPPQGVVKFSHTRTCLERIQNDPEALQSVHFERPKARSGGDGDPACDALEDEARRTCAFWLSVLGEEMSDVMTFRLEYLALKFLGPLGYI